MARRVPFIPQMEAVECAAASLCMVLAYHGRHEELSIIRRACSVSRDGSSAKNILAGAKHYGLVAKARRTEPEGLRDCTGPAILHWRMEHFVVLEGMEADGRARIVDPATGPRRVSVDELDKSFTGICMEFSPGPSFVRKAKTGGTGRRLVRMIATRRGPLLLIALAALAIDLLAVATPIATQLMIDEVVSARHAAWLRPVGAVLLALVALGVVYAVLRDVLALGLRRTLDRALTTELVEHMFALPMGFFAQRTTGDLVGRVRSLATMRELLGAQSSALLVDGVMLIGYLGVMLAFDPGLTVVVAAAAALYVVVFVASRPALADVSQEKQLKDSAATASLIGLLRGIATIKSAGAERRARTEWLSTFISALNASSRLSLDMGAVTIILHLLKLGAGGAVVILGARRVLQGEMSIGALVGFQLLQAGFLGPLEKIVDTVLRLQALPTVLARMDDVLAYEREPSGEVKAPQLEGKIELRDVTFRYAELSAPVVANVSLTIQPGTKVALVGASGSGKSSLAKILLGLHLPSSGKILFDGHDLATLDLASVRRQIGVVLQDTALFEGTVAENLRLFHPDAPMEHVVSAARVARIHDDIEALPRGYETRIAEQGGPLSGGQRQRLALTRAILHRPPIMVLDEATSALDTVTEAAIERYLNTRRCTRIVIAHRLSTVRDADTIFVLDKGALVESGRHEDLCAAGGAYARLVAAETGVAAAAHDDGAARNDPVLASDLEAFDVFAGLSPEDRVAVADLLERRFYGEADVVLQQDEKPTGLHLIVAGQVIVELAEPGLETWTVAELGAGDLVGELGLLDGSPNSATVRAVEAVRTLHLPLDRFEDLAKHADARATSILLSLGALAARRTLEVVEREGEARQESVRAMSVLPGPPEQEAPRRRGQALRLRETLLCATMSEAEVEVIERLGAPVSVRRGQRLFAAHDVLDAFYAVLSGRIEYRGEERVDTLDPGELAGEASVWGDARAPFAAVAVTDATVFAVDRAAFLNLVLSGAPAAQKALAYLARALVMQLRLSNFRLREVVARNRGELAKADRARVQALEAAADRVGLAEDDDRDHLVRTAQTAEACAACLTTLLRQMRRSVSLRQVLEAFDRAPGLLPRRLGVTATSFGLFARRLDLLTGELARFERPLIAELDDQRWCVLIKRGPTQARVLDPVRGVSIQSVDAIERAGFTGVAFEVFEERADERAGLFERIGRFFTGRTRDLALVGSLAVATDTIALLVAMSTAAVVAFVVPVRDAGLLGLIAGGIAVALVAHGVFSRVQSRALEYLRAHFDRELVDQMARHLLGLPIAFFDRHPPGDVLQRFFAFEYVRTLLSSQAAPALLSVVSLVVATVLLGALSSTFVVVCLLATALYAVAARMILPRIKRLAADRQRARAVENERLIEAIGGIATLRLCGDRRIAVRRYTDAFDPSLAASVREETWRTLALTALDGGKNVLLAGGVVWGAQSIESGALGIAGYAAAVAVASTFLATLHAVFAQVVQGASALVEYELVRSTFDEPSEQRGGLRLVPGRLRGAITLDNVSFRYDDGPLILQNVSLQIPAGAKVAMVGASGSGKSTLGKLLLGLYLPSHGRVLFDGKDLVNLDLQALRSQIGVVLQEPHLLATTLRENLVLGAEQASYSDMIDAAERAAIHDDIAALPMGYSTLVSEGGGSLSGGQRQRCVLARALITRPAILLLDEATSALDNVAQNAIEQSLAESRATRIVIAHRLSTVRNADLIIVLDRGRVVETGRHDELVARGGAYARLVEAQL